MLRWWGPVGCVVYRPWVLWDGLDLGVWRWGILCCGLTFISACPYLVPKRRASPLLRLDLPSSFSSVHLDHWGIIGWLQLMTQWPENDIKEFNIGWCLAFYIGPNSPPSTCLDCHPTSLSVCERIKNDIYPCSINPPARGGYRVPLFLLLLLLLHLLRRLSNDTGMRCVEGMGVLLDVWCITLDWCGSE